MAPFLALPVDRHYFYQGFSNLPVSLASWWLMGSSIDLMAPRADITFRKLLGAIGLPYGILVLPLMWLPDTIVLIGWPWMWMAPWWVAVTPVRVALGTLWVYSSCTLAVKVIYGFSFFRAAPATFMGLVVAIAMSFVFIR